MSESIEKVDVVIIGAGPSGAVLAWRLATAGFKVTCLEQGDWVDQDSLLSDRDTAELAWMERWNPDPRVRKAPADYPVVNGGASIMPAMANGVGGSMIQWAAMWHPLLPSDFRVKTLDGVADDWPIDWHEMVPYYERATKEMAVSGLGDDPAYPDMASAPNPPLPIGMAGYCAAHGLASLGRHWWPGSNAIASRRYGAVSQCELRGVCIIGCPSRAKATPGAVYWPLAEEAGAKLVTGARVFEVNTDPQGRATGASYIGRDGIRTEQKAGVVIMAANAIGTSRLLLLSKSARFPDGLANDSGLVGKNLMQHPYATVRAVVEDGIESWKGPFGEGIYSLEYAETQADRGFVRGTKWMTSPGQGPVVTFANAVESLEHDDFDKAWGRPLMQRLTEDCGQTFTWGIQCDDLPEEHNCVDLDESVVDSDGIPAPRIRYTVSENSERMLKFNIDRCLEAVEASGAKRTYVKPLWDGGIGHALGTARMGTDPTGSVVDPWGRSHDVENLFVVDSSVFVTGGSANPGATIIALAHRFADQMIANRSNQVTA